MDEVRAIARRIAANNSIMLGEALWLAQQKLNCEGHCMLCHEKSEVLQLDHEHAYGQYGPARAWLCRPCNMFVGHCESAIRRGHPEFVSDAIKAYITHPPFEQKSIMCNPDRWPGQEPIVSQRNE